ncbi:hypothetical protein N7455_008753 [Penicillium solitum]|uniref:uncharacterized protein n=1 Tax=Penicillium solitum TaxID=60172 RepID=UPI0032C46619|nr:hypothetical protein N7455_008753 [Penicillium solitum]
MSSHRVQPSTRPPEYCPNCASYLTILPRATDSVHGFQNYFTCRACPYICRVSESESCEDESCSDETSDDKTTDDEAVNDEAVDDEAVDDEAVDDEAVDDEAVDDEAVDDESPVDPLKEYIYTAVQEMQDIQDGRVTSLLADTKFPSQAFMFPKQDEGVYLSNIPLGRVVQHMVTKILETNSQKKRYQDFVNNCENIESLLLGSLAMDTLAVVQGQSIGPNELIKIGGDPEIDPNAGVYLHILLIPGLMYLYTGQADDLSERIRYHKDPAFRRRHPSLHYKIWEWLEETGGLTSVFVKVAGFKQKLRGESDQLLLNLQEMLTACVFQTLRSSDLEFYLPDEVEICWGGRGLNVALPIWQGYTLGEGKKFLHEMGLSKQDFSAALHSQDILVRECAMEVRDAYQSLRNHPDPRVQEVWVQGFRRFQDAAAKRIYSRQDQEDISSNFDYSLYFFEGRLSYGRGGGRKWTIELQQKSFKSAQEFLSSGKQVGLYRTGGRGVFLVYYSLYNISLSTVSHLLRADGDTIPEKSGYVPGKSVFLKPILLTRPTRLRYVQRALPNDPASRLIILADIEPGDGTG